MNVAPLEQLAESWREEADHFRRRGMDREADMAESYAADLEDCLRNWATEPLTVAEASTESEYTERHLRELLSEEKIPNAGEPGSPRIRRADLPAKPGGGGPTLEVSEGGKTIAERALERRRS